MLILTFGVVLTAILLARVGYWGKQHAADLGSMSHQWVAAYQASQHASSI
jgi:hypothetical protein